MQEFTFKTLDQLNTFEKSVRGSFDISDFLKIKKNENGN
jgi:hypothetical protein